MQRIMYAAAIAAVLSVILLATKTTEAVIRIEELQKNQKVKFGMHYIIRGKEYRANDPVNWNIAEEIGGFYFSRARWLGLPEPPAAIVANPKKLSDEELKIIDNYHAQFKAAEAGTYEPPARYQSLRLH